MPLTNRRTAYLRNEKNQLSLADVKTKIREQGITKEQFYEALHIAELVKKTNKKWQTRNARNAKRRKTTPELTETQLYNQLTELIEEQQRRNDLNITKREPKRFKTKAATQHTYENPDQNPSLSIIGKTAKDLVDGVKELTNIKVQYQMIVMFRKPFEEKEESWGDGLAPFYFTSDPVIILNIGQVKQCIDITKQNLQNWIEENHQRGSGWKYVYVDQLSVTISAYQPLRGGSYVELDDYVKNKKCCINIKNTDNKCIKYCILLDKHKDFIKSHPERVSHYARYENDFDWSSIKFPVGLNQIDKIEKLINKPISVYGYSDKRVFPLRITKMTNEKEVDGMIRKFPCEGVINLLLVDNKHYVYITKLDVLVSPIQRDANDKHIALKSFVCQNCLHCFSSKLRLDNHRTNGCDMFEPTKTELPKMIKTEEGWETPTITFNRHTRKFKAPVVIYADFETLIEKYQNIHHNEGDSSTTKLAELPPCSFKFNVVSDYPQLNMGHTMFRGENAAFEFMQKLVKVGDDIRNVLDYEHKMIITKKQELQFQKCTCCHICDKPFKGDDVKVRDHDHINGLYRGAAHQDCNVNFNYKKYKIPVYFHNLKNFDGHLIIQALTKMGFSNIKLIAQNFEKYMCIDVGNFRFLDSFAFMSSSLDTLAKNLLKDGIENFKHTLNGDYTNAQKKLLLKKGIYPYEYMDSFAKFEEIEFPPIEAFYSQLNEDNISQEDYEFGELVYKTFNCKNLGDYHDLYLHNDVMLLTDIFETFRKTAMSNYDLDPANGYFTLPNFAWDAMLKKTGVSLDQLTDVDMYLFCEQAIRGGTSLISHRYAKANNKYMSDFNENMVSSFIMYLDANNLYGEAMIQNLPTGDFKWVDIDEDFIRSYDENSKFGYFVKCDLQYPQHLHDTHNNYPLAVESRGIKKVELSPYQLNQMKVHKERHSEKLKKLVPNLYDKKEYVCHIRNLKYYLEKGLVLTKIHTSLKFTQSKWLKPYINFNTEKRKLSKNEFEKDLYKLMNNAVFGKTMENMRGRVKIDMYTDKKQYLTQVAKPQFLESKIYSEDLIAVKKTPKVVELNKPIYVGVATLDLSKLHMYGFHYDYIKPKYGEKATLLFTDTDSLCYKIETEDMYKDMSEDKHLFDMSDYSMDGYRSQDNTNKKVIGKFKDETSGVPIVEFCGLRSKMYSILLENDKEKMTGKGIKKSALKKYVKHQDYRRCLMSSFSPDQRQLISFNNLRSVDHNIGLYRYTKVGLSCANDKQYLLDDGITSYSYGHYKIPR